MSGLQPIVIVVPVLRRPHRVAPLIENVAAVTTGPHRLLFVASPHDTAEHQALEAAGADWMLLSRMVAPGDFARKVNAAFHLTTEPLLLMVGDDVVFHPRWNEAAQAALRPGVGVIGTNDVANPRVMRGEHSTHPIVVRDYINERGGTMTDGPGVVLHERYAHNFCDDELVATAKHRDAWVFAPSAIIEHRHPDWGTADRDEVYNLGRAGWRRDRERFRRRSALWQ